MSPNSFDLIVIGAGPGGYVAALRAAQLGLSVACVEREHLGGVCLNWGCIPTKALLKSAQALRTMQGAASYGLQAGDVGHDLGAIVDRSRRVADQLSGGVKFLLRKNKVHTISGEGSLKGPGEVLVRTTEGEQLLRAPNVLLATGARPRDLPGLEADGDRVWHYKHALQPPRQPANLLVIGSGAIGVEFASFFHALGATTTVIEVQDRILPSEDAEISALACESLRKQGMRVHTGTRVTALHRGASGVEAQLEGGDGSRSESFDTVISAVGIRGNWESMGLEGLGVEIRRDHVVVDGYCRTGIEGLYAIGDLVDGPWLAHKASHEGVMVAELVAGKRVEPLHRDCIPACTYSHPQVASIGLSEADAVAAGHAVRVGRFPFMANGKAIATGDAQGLVKLVFSTDTDRLLGAHLIGAEVTELIHGLSVAIQAELTSAQLSHTVFAHPTLGEAIPESALSASGRALHI